MEVSCSSAAAGKRKYKVHVKIAKISAFELVVYDNVTNDVYMQVTCKYRTSLSSMITIAKDGSRPLSKTVKSLHQRCSIHSNPTNCFYLLIEE